jgi:hypothetical protein
MNQTGTLSMISAALCTACQKNNVKKGTWKNNGDDMAASRVYAHQETRTMAVPGIVNRGLASSPEM